MIYMFLADGFEETEAIATLDILRRAEVCIKTVGIGKKQIMGAHGVQIAADLEENEVDFSDNYAGVVLPGGMKGTLTMCQNATVQKAVQIAFDKNLLLAAICAAPMVPGKMGLLKGKRVTCYPGCEANLIDAVYTAKPVCTDNNIITAFGPGAATRFGLTVAEHLTSKEKASSVEAAFKCAL